MKLFASILAAAATAFAAASAAGVSESQTLPAFPAEYHAEFTFSLPYASLTMPVVADVTSDSQRVSYYQGMDTFIMSNSEQKSWAITPIVDTLTCTTSDGTDFVNPVPAADVVSNYVFVKNTVLNGHAVKMYQWDHQVEQTTNTYTFYTDANTGSPVEWHQMGRDTFTPSHSDEYVIVYSAWNPKPSFPAGTFTGPTNMTCVPLITDDNGVAGAADAGALDALREATAHPADAAPGLDAAFKQYAAKYGKQYNGAADATARQAAWKRARHFVAVANARNAANGATYKLAMNHLADELPAEKARRTGKSRVAAAAVHDERLAEAGIHPQPVMPAVATHKFDPHQVLPAAHTWKGTGQVGPVRDQSTCGSCFSFAASQAFTGAYYRATQQTVEFSVQAALDCSWPWGNDACDGGLDYQVYSWVAAAGGWPTKASYPYLGQNGYCHDSKPDVYKPATVSRYFNVTSGDNTALKSALFNVGPVSVSIDAALPSFDYYSSGVYNDKTCSNSDSQQDHSVLAVGYDDAKGAWLIQNSWSTHWGDEGMVWIAYDLCGVTDGPTYPEAKLL